IACFRTIPQAAGGNKLPRNHVRRRTGAARRTILSPSVNSHCDSSSNERQRMREILQFLIAHGYTILFFWVMAEQIGLPLPSAPMLLAAGALAGAGRMHIRSAVSLAMIAALMADSLWYEIGRRRGARV